MKTKKERILEYLQAGGAISQKLSINLFGCASLAQRIRELRTSGHLIETHFVTQRYGKSKITYAVYKLAS